MRFMSLSTPFLLILACGEKDPTTETDTGEITEEEEVISYEAGCFVVDGGDGYKYLNAAIAMANEGSQISPVGCDSFEHEEKVTIDKSVRLVGIGQDRFTIVAPVNETAITITADNVELSDFAVQSTRSGISIEGATNVHIHNLTVSEVGNYAIKSLDSDLQLDDLTLWNNQDGAIGIDGGSVVATGLDVRGNVGNSIVVDGGSTLTLSESEVSEGQPTDPANLVDGFGVFIDGGSTLLSTDNVYTGNTLVGVQSVNGTIEMSGDVVSGSLSTGIWGEGQGSMTLNDVTVEGNLTYGVINMTTGGASFTDVLITVDPLMTPSYDIDSWEDSGFGSMGLFVNSPAVNIDGLEITGYNNCGANFQTDNGTEFSVEGLNIHDVGRKGLIIAGHTGTMNNIVIKDIFDLDGNSSKEPDENGVVADYAAFCQTVDKNAGATVITSDLTISNVLTENVEGYGWSVIQANVDLDTALAQNNTCSSFLAFQGGLQARNLDIANNSFEYDGLGAGVVGYAATLFTVEDSTFRADTEELLDISAFLYDSTGSFTNSTFTGGGIGVYSNASSVSSTGNTYRGQSGYSAFLNTASTSGSEHMFTDDIFDGMAMEDSTSIPVPIYCSDAGLVGVDGSSFSDVSAAYALYLNSCSSEIEDATFTNISNYTIYAYNGDHDISNTTLDTVNTVASYYSALYLFGAEAMNISLADVSIVNGNGDGIYGYATDPENNPMMLDISGLSLESIGDDAIYLYGTEAYLEDIVIDGAAQGVYANSATVNMANTSIANTTESAVYLTSSTATIDTLTVNDALDNGVYASGGTLSLSNGDINSSTNAGLFAENSADLTVDTSSFENNLYGIHLDGIEGAPIAFSITNSSVALSTLSGILLNYADGNMDSNLSNNNQELGMECTESILSSCAGNDLTSNILGEQSGCDETCGIEANPPE